MEVTNERVEEPQAALPIAVEEELRLLRVVKAAAERVAPQWAGDGDYDAQLLQLRDDLAQERLPEDRASIIEQMERLARLRAQRANYQQTALDIRSPYFAHMRLKNDDGSNRDILLGRQTWVRDGIRVVDWRNAPISKVFYQREEGEDYEIPVAGRLLEGEVAVRRTVTIRDGELRRVACPAGTWALQSGSWENQTANMPALRGGAGVALRPDRMQPVLGQAAPGASRTDKHLPEIASLLDPKQFDLITRPESGVLAIQGSAGSGKTTVALHRVAYLAYQDARRFRGARCLLVVFSPALASYISQVLPALGVMDAQVRTYDSWVRSIRLRLFSKAPNIVAEDTPASVVRFKLHSALVPMIEEGIEANPDLGPWDLFEELFTNRQWVQSVERHAPGAFSANERKEILRWCSDMHFVRAEGGGHREHEVPSLDAEDDTLLLYLYQRVKGPLVSRKGRPLRYGHVVIDEAQDLSPVELRLLHGTVETGGAMTLAGDTAQRVVEHNDFVDWFHVLESLGLEHVSVSPLKVSYRSTASIMALAHEVLGPLAPPEAASPTRDGMEPELLRFRARGEAFTFLADALRELVQKEPSANVGVLVRHSWQAKEAYEALSRTDLDPLHRVVDHEFSFAPGIEVAEIRQAKGLEFDYVVLLDVDVDTYPRTDMARHLLHIGITRAAHQVWCFCVGSPSGLLPASIQTIQL